MASTIQQQLDFISELRENYDLNCRERITTNREPKKVVELLRDIHESLVGVRNWQLGQKVELCSDCNAPLSAQNRENFAVSNDQVIVTRNEHVCDRCTDKRIERLNNSTIGIP